MSYRRGSYHPPPDGNDLRHFRAVASGFYDGTTREQAMAGDSTGDRPIPLDLRMELARIADRLDALASLAWEQGLAIRVGTHNGDIEYHNPEYPPFAGRLRFVPSRDWRQRRRDLFGPEEQAGAVRRGKRSICDRED